MSEDPIPASETEPSLHEALTEAFDFAVSSNAGETLADDVRPAEPAAGPTRDERGRFARSEESVDDHPTPRPTLVRNLRERPSGRRRPGAPPPRPASPPSTPSSSRRC